MCKDASLPPPGCSLAAQDDILLDADNTDAGSGEPLSFPCAPPGC